MIARHCAVCIHLSTDKPDYPCVHCGNVIQQHMSIRLRNGVAAAIQWRRNCLPGVVIVMAVVRACVGISALVAEPVAAAIHPLLGHAAHWGGGLCLMWAMMSILAPIESAIVLPVAQVITDRWHKR